MWLLHWLVRVTRVLLWGVVLAGPTILHIGLLGSVRGGRTLWMHKHAWVRVPMLAGDMVMMRVIWGHLRVSTAMVVLLLRMLGIVFVLLVALRSVSLRMRSRVGVIRVWGSGLT